MTAASSSLTKFSVKPHPDSAALARSTAAVAPITRGKNKRVGVAVRLNHEDWYRATELALREHTSLQQLLVAGLSELMKQRGLPPLSGS